MSLTRHDLASLQLLKIIKHLSLWRNLILQPSSLWTSLNRCFDYYFHFNLLNWQHLRDFLMRNDVICIDAALSFNVCSSKPAHTFKFNRKNFLLLFVPSIRLWCLACILRYITPYIHKMCKIQLSKYIQGLSEKYPTLLFYDEGSEH